MEMYQLLILILAFVWNVGGAFCDVYEFKDQKNFTGSRLQDKYCPHGFIHYQRSCYKFSNQRASWLEAKAYCEAMMASLASIQYWQENRFIVRYIRKEQKSFTKSFWIGGNDLANEKEWRWVANGDLVKYKSWYHGQPDNAGKRGEHCMEMERKFHYQWNDQSCHHRNHFICEIPRLNL